MEFGVNRQPWSSRKEPLQPSPSEVTLKPLYVPLLGTNLNRPLGDGTLVHKPDSSASPAEKRRMELPSSRTPSREPDDIQILIGRIEVTAVPQTARGAGQFTASRGFEPD